MIKNILSIIFSSVIIFTNIAYSYEKEEKFVTPYGDIWVYDSAKGLRCMTFGTKRANIVQSCMFIDNPRKVYFPYIAMLLSSVTLKEHAPQNILVIGLGGASAQKAMAILTPEAKNIDTVEINDALPAIVAKHFEYFQDDINHIYVQDAEVFVALAPRGKYDLIFMDAFDQDYIPAKLLTDEFMQNVKGLLSKDGILAMNSFISSKTYQQESQLISRNFGDYYNLRMNSSRIMITSNAQLPQMDQIRNNAAKWRDKFLQLGVNLGVLLDSFDRQDYK
jgi:spermidine synthase